MNFFGKGSLRLRSLSLSDFFLDLFRGFSSEKEIVLRRDTSSDSADGDGEVSQTPSRSSLETQVAELRVYGRARSLVASLCHVPRPSTPHAFLWKLCKIG